MDNELAILKQKVADLTSIVEGLLARHPQNLPPAQQIAVVNGSGQLLDWNGTSWVPDTTAGTITSQPPPGTLVVYRPQTQQWFTFGNGLAIAQLGASLSAGGNAAATFLFGGSGSVPGGVTDVMLCPGATIASGSKVWIGLVAGTWYLNNTNCPC